jgi:outer membrane PBP1 activator LpoA protein
MTKLKSGRLILDEGAIAALSSMYEEMKNQKCVKITPSKLGSWIISEFYKSFFSRYKGKIAKEHFNSKEYLKKMMSNVDENENLEDVLRQALNQIKKPTTKKPRGVQNPQQEENVQQ